MIIEPLLSNGRLLRFYHSGFQSSCQNMFRLILQFLFETCFRFDIYLQSYSLVKLEICVECIQVFTQSHRHFFRVLTKTVKCPINLRINLNIQLRNVLSNRLLGHRRTGMTFNKAFLFVLQITPNNWFHILNLIYIWNIRFEHFPVQFIDTRNCS
jgi:hypothetical protein